MTQMKKVPLRIFTDSERLELLAHIIVTLQQLGSEDSYIVRLIAKFLLIQTDLDDAVHKSRGSSLSDEIERLNALRKKLLTDIRMGLRFALRDEEEGILLPAQVIDGMYKQSFDNIDMDKSSDLNVGIKTFLEQVEQPRPLESCGKILLGGKVTKLRSTQESYLHMIQRRAESEELDDSPLLIPTRNEVLKLYNTLRVIVNFNIYCEESGFDELAQKLNGRIGEIAAIAKSRNTHETNEIEEEEIIES